MRVIVYSQLETVSPPGFDSFQIEAILANTVISQHLPWDAWTCDSHRQFSANAR